jgi:lauroyl/myristoyl acyltransferase
VRQNLHHANEALALRLRWRVEAFGLGALLLLLQGRSHRTMQRGIRAGLGLARPLLGKRLATATANLERVYGQQLSASQRQRLAELSLQNFLLACLESIIQPVPERRITVEGEGLVDLLGHQRSGRGLIVASLHLGCWDIGLRWLSQHVDNLAVVYRPAKNPLTDPMLNRARSANSHCAWIASSNRWAMVRHLRRGGGLVLMSDLRSGTSNLIADFLGLETRFSRGPMVLSQLARVPVFPVAHVREDNGRFRLICGAPLRPQSPHPEGEASAHPAGVEAGRNLQEQLQVEALARWQEPWIQAYAEQYYWINRRWRRDEGKQRRLLPPPAARVLQKLTASGGMANQTNPNQTNPDQPRA